MCCEHPQQKGGNLNIFPMPSVQSLTVHGSRELLGFRSLADEYRNKQHCQQGQLLKDLDPLFGDP